MEHKEVRLYLNPVDVSGVRIRRFKRALLVDATFGSDEIWWMRLRRDVRIVNPSDETWFGVAMYDAVTDFRFDLWRRIILPGDSFTLYERKA
jgi:hypothetical protein